MLPVNAENPQDLGVPFGAILTFFWVKHFFVSDAKQCSILRFFHFDIYLSASETLSLSSWGDCVCFAEDFHSAYTSLLISSPDNPQWTDGNICHFSNLVHVAPETQVSSPKHASMHSVTLWLQGTRSAIAQQRRKCSLRSLCEIAHPLQPVGQWW